MYKAQLKGLMDERDVLVRAAAILRQRDDEATAQIIDKHVDRFTAEIDMETARRSAVMSKKQEGMDATSAWPLSKRERFARWYSVSEHDDVQDAIRQYDSDNADPKR